MVPIDTITTFPIEGVLSNKFDSPIPDLLNAGATFDLIQHVKGMATGKTMSKAR